MPAHLPSTAGRTRRGEERQPVRGVAALGLLADTGVTYLTAHDPAGDVAQAYGLYGMPTTVFISLDRAAS